jgi:hypothetical protein
MGRTTRLAKTRNLLFTGGFFGLFGTALRAGGAPPLYPRGGVQRANPTGALTWPDRGRGLRPHTPGLFGAAERNMALVR